MQPVADLSGEPALVQADHLVLARQVQPQQLLPLRHLQVRVGIFTNMEKKTPLEELGVAKSHV